MAFRDTGASTRGLEPLEPEVEAVISHLVRNLLAKPGFVRNDAVKDYLTRAMRLLLIEVRRMEPPRRCGLQEGMK
jgi:hypothetical protein